MKSVELKARPRTELGTQAVKRLRAAGKVPAIIYGRSISPQPLEVDAVELEEVLHHSVSENVLVYVKVEGEPDSRLAIIKEVQHHPIKGKILHVDFQQVAEEEKVTITVPVEAVGEAAGVKAGGILEHVLFQLEVRAKPKDLPEIIHVDVSNLGLGETLHVRDIQPPPGVEILTDPEVPVITIVKPAVSEEGEEAVAEAQVEETEEPEVIKRGKEEEEKEE